MILWIALLGGVISAATLAELAREAKLSVVHFNRVFKKQFGISPMNYVIQKRVALACSLLTETGQPLKQVGERVGYRDPFFFSRQFKKVMGVSPSGYRQKHRRLTPGRQ